MRPSSVSSASYRMLNTVGLGATIAGRTEIPLLTWARMLPLPPIWVAIALATAPVAVPVRVPAGRAARADSIIVDATLALERGRPWAASRLIAVVLADSSRRTPDALMLAATAA